MTQRCTNSNNIFKRKSLTEEKEFSTLIQQQSIKHASTKNSFIHDFPQISTGFLKMASIQKKKKRRRRRKQRMRMI